MQIISHRGYWKTTEEKNKKIAFERSFNLGFGTETDLRDICGKIVISHDMSTGDEISFEEILQIMNGRNLPLALNIKADGQADEIKRLLEKYNHTNYFTFDMSIPDLVVQIKKGLNAYTGISDINSGSLLVQTLIGGIALSDLLTLAYLFFIGSVLGWVLELLYRNIISTNHKWINPVFCT